MDTDSVYHLTTMKIKYSDVYVYFFMLLGKVKVIFSKEEYRTGRN